MPKIAETDRDIIRCFDTIAELRPHLKRRDVLTLVRQMQVDGYRIAFIEESGRVLAVAGYRILTNLHMGRHLYVEDLVTANKARSKGLGGQMVRWLSCNCGIPETARGPDPGMSGQSGPAARPRGRLSVSRRRASR